MKRIFSFALIFALIATTSFAEPASALLKIATDYSEKITTVSAPLGEEFAGRRVNVIILNPGFGYGDLKNKTSGAVNWAQQVIADENGEFAAQMTLTPSEKDGEISYTAVVAPDKGSAIVKTFELYNQGFANKITDEINNAVKDNDISVIERNFEQYAGLLGIDDTDEYAKYAAYDTDRKTSVLNGFIREMINKTNNIAAAFCACVLAAELNGITDKKAYENALKPLIADAKESVKNEFENMEKGKKDEFIAELMKTDFSCSFDIIATLNKKLVLDGINSALIWTECASLYLKYADVLGINTSDYNALSDKKSAIQPLLNKDFKTEKDAADAFDKATAAQKKYENEPKIPQGGSSTSKGSSAKGGISAPSVVPTPVPDVKRVIFSDLDGFGWAKEDIEYLAEKEIVSGIGGDAFAPGKSITRAEFTKLVCGVFDIKQSGTEANFSDVSKDDWYYEFINAAYSQGIINGNADGNFMPGDVISREDIAVILGRCLMKNDEFDSALEFADADDISDYAVKYVKYLVGLKVINGYEDNTFRPKNGANRAESAVLISKILRMKGAE